MSRLKIQLYVERGVVVAEWSPLQPGSPVVGRGETVLEAVGDLVIQDQLVSLEPAQSDLLKRRYSAMRRAMPQRSSASSGN